MSLESMIDVLRHSLIGIGLVTLLELAVIARILLRPHRDPASESHGSWSLACSLCWACSPICSWAR